MNPLWQAGSTMSTHKSLPSREPVIEGTQPGPHCLWSFTDVTFPFVVQPTASTSVKSTNPRVPKWFKPLHKLLGLYPKYWDTYSSSAMNTAPSAARCNFNPFSESSSGQEVGLVLVNVHPHCWTIVRRHMRQRNNSTPRSFPGQSRTRNLPRMRHLGKGDDGILCDITTNTGNGEICTLHDHHRARLAPVLQESSKLLRDGRTHLSPPIHRFLRTSLPRSRCRKAHSLVNVRDAVLEGVADHSRGAITEMRSTMLSAPLVCTSWTRGC